MADKLQNWFAYRHLAIDKVRRGYSFCLPDERRSADPPRGSATLIFTILEEPSFDDVVGWQVYRVTDADDRPSFHADRMAWKQEKDSLRIYNLTEEPKRFGQKNEAWPAPTMEYPSVIADPAIVQRPYERIVALRLPIPKGVNSVGLDGTSYELILRTTMTRVILRWWEEGPTEWAEAGEIVTEMFLHLEGLRGVEG